MRRQVRHPRQVQNSVGAAFALICAVLPGEALARAKAPPPQPSVEAAPGLPAPPQARFYADCIAQAAAARTYDREGNLIRFTCTGDPARVFFDGLAAWSAKADSRIEANGRQWRFTQKITKNPFGVDYCSTDATGADPRCVVVLNVGAFLAFQGE